MQLRNNNGTWANARHCAALLAMLLGAFACSPAQRGCFQESIECVGLVTGYGGVRSGIEQQAWLALQDSKAAGMVDRVDYIETVDTRDRAANIAVFADAGYDVVVTTGAGIMDETLAAAELHPNALFVVIQPGQDPADIPANLVPLEFHEEQGGFLAGAAAAMMTRTRRVAAICEARFIDYVVRYCQGFAAGARYVDEQVQAVIVYREGADELLFQDTSWGSAAAAQVVDDGADVVFAVGEATARAALNRAAEQGALVIAAQTDLYEEMPEIREHLVTSATVKVRDSLGSLLRAYVKSQLPGGPFGGDVGLASFHEYDNQMPPGVASRLMSIQAELTAGVLSPNMSIEAP